MSYTRASKGAKQESGMVILEFALVIPLLIFVALGAAWLLRVGQVQAQLDDAVRGAAREIARGTEPRTADKVAGRILPGIRIKVGETGSAPVLVKTVGTYELESPIPRLGIFKMRLRSEMVAAKESLH